MDVFAKKFSAHLNCKYSFRYSKLVCYRRSIMLDEYIQQKPLYFYSVVLKILHRIISIYFTCISNFTRGKEKLGKSRENKNKIRIWIKVYVEDSIPSLRSRDDHPSDLLYECGWQVYYLVQVPKLLLDNSSSVVPLFVNCNVDNVPWRGSQPPLAVSPLAVVARMSKTGVASRTSRLVGKFYSVPL